jgi:hypothetical protein
VTDKKTTKKKQKHLNIIKYENSPIIVIYLPNYLEKKKKKMEWEK